MFVYRVLFLDGCLGLAIDRCYGSNCSPITHYHFWPKNEAWDQIRLELESKPWITSQEEAEILNKTSEIFNSWQRGELQPPSKNYYFSESVSNGAVQIIGQI